MSVVIKQVFRMDHDRHFGTIQHNGHTLSAVLVGSYDLLREFVGLSLTAEYGLCEIISVETNVSREVGSPGIFQGAIENQFVLDGIVQIETVLDETVSQYDICFSNDDDCLPLSSKELETKPSLDSRIRITGSGLQVYPVLRQA